MRPTYLELQETAKDQWSATWKQPITNGQRLKIDPVFPEKCAVGEDQIELVNGTLIKRFNLTCALDTGEIRVTGLDRTLTDTFIRIIDLSGHVRSSVLRGSNTVFSLASQSSAAPVMAYFRIGVEHIVFG